MKGIKQSHGELKGQSGRKNTSQARYARACSRESTASLMNGFNDVIGSVTGDAGEWGDCRSEFTNLLPGGIYPKIL